MINVRNIFLLVFLVFYNSYLSASSQPPFLINVNSKEIENDQSFLIDFDLAVNDTCSLTDYHFVTRFVPPLFF